MSNQHTYNDSDILLRISLGDEEAMRSIFQVYYPKLCFFANSLIDNKEQAKDIAQEALLQFWNQRSIFSNQKEENLAAYLFTVVRRDCYDYSKHQRIKRVKQNDIKDQIQISEEGVDDKIIYFEVLNRVYEEIKNLPPHLLEIVTLSFIEGLSTQEISDRLQITPNNVRVQKSRALEKLKNAILKENMIVPSSISLFFFENFMSRM